ncbi:VQ motif-containing protein 19 [Mercurialis annua]|uniref:VQ motif-containing protein 19 n=1 Tax=Mercurialis annua TaxID=3986 RepID=UPI002160EEBB|nr:VQ motif-containing protein 19 [Mercurialis annua]
MNQEMDQTPTRIQENKNLAPIFNNGVTTHTPPLTPISRSDTPNNNPYPTTFVQADSSSFKQVVQMLTGSTETAKQASQDPPLTPTSSSSTPPQTRNFAIPPIKTTPKKQQQQQNSFKLYERRNNYQFQNSLMINTLLPSFCNSNSNSFSPREILSPSLLEFPKLTLSPVTPLNIEDPFYKNSPSPSLANSSSSEEERAIAEKGFYLHPSPISTPRDSEPQLLPLFPVTSPRISGS